MSRILVIDDSPAALQMVEMILRESGHEVVICPDGKCALQALHREDFDLIVTDIYMPDQDGLEVIRRGRELRPNIPIVAMSGVTGQGNMLAIATRMGACRTVQKPFSRSELVEAVVGALGTVKAEESNLRVESLVSAGSGPVNGKTGGWAADSIPQVAAYSTEEGSIMTGTNQLLSPELSEDSTELSPATFARLAQFIKSELGIKMPDSKLSMMQSRLLRRVRDLRLQSVDHYAEYFFASANGHEREHFINAITTNKTDFFRESEHFAYLVDVVLPELANSAKPAGERIKAWSAGCSSGEEPYTLAMVLAEYAGKERRQDFAVLATDISTKVLKAARNGIYQHSQVVPVPPELRKKYLLRSRNNSENLVRVVPQLRNKVSFHQLNFMDDDYSIKDMFDFIFFRNVMIYFDKSTQEAVINKICRNLAPGGYLFAGHSESLAGLDIPVKAVKTSIYRKRG